MLEKEDYLVKNSIVKREFLLRYLNEEKRVTSLQVLNWPDHDAPDSFTGYQTIEYLFGYINEYKLAFPQSPVLVHCSAGLGRTGTLIAIYNIFRSFWTLQCLNTFLVEEEKIKPFLSVFNVVRKLREQRLGMVTDEKQYMYIYKFAFDWLERNFELPSNDNLCCLL
jgi:protein tyrosine phosphatase